MRGPRFPSSSVSVCQTAQCPYPGLSRRRWIEKTKKKELCSLSPFWLIILAVYNKQIYVYLIIYIILYIYIPNLPRVSKHCSSYSKSQLFPSLFCCDFPIPGTWIVRAPGYNRASGAPRTSPSSFCTMGRNWEPGRITWEGDFIGYPQRNETTKPVFVSGSGFQLFFVNPYQSIPCCGRLHLRGPPLELPGADSKQRMVKRQGKRSERFRGR